jgi:hypothetical protein
VSRKYAAGLLGLAVALATLALIVAASLVNGGQDNSPRAYAEGDRVDLDQWANDDTPPWQNGNLNRNNSSYTEGDVVPFRLAIEGLTKGLHTIELSYDFTEGGHKAYDFLATYNATEADVDLCAAGGGGVSSLCAPLPDDVSSMGFPSDPTTVDGLTVAGAEAGLDRQLKLYGGTITHIDMRAHDGDAADHSQVEIEVTFSMDGENSDQAALFAWGGHIARSSYWNVAAGGRPDGALQIPGAPWHMRLGLLDGGHGEHHQERSIQIGRAGEGTPTFTPTNTPIHTATNTPVPHVHTHTPGPHVHTPTAVPPTATHTQGAGVLAEEATPRPAGAVLPTAGAGAGGGNNAIAMLISGMAGTGLLLLEAGRRLWSRRRG